MPEKHGCVFPRISSDTMQMEKKQRLLFIAYPFHNDDIPILPPFRSLHFSFQVQSLNYFLIGRGGKKVKISPVF
jgi:hypothetical protein